MPSCLSSSPLPTASWRAWAIPNMAFGTRTWSRASRTKCFTGWGSANGRLISPASPAICTMWATCSRVKHLVRDARDQVRVPKAMFGIAHALHDAVGRGDEERQLGIGLDVLERDRRRRPARCIRGIECGPALGRPPPPSQPRSRELRVLILVFVGVLGLVIVLVLCEPTGEYLTITMRVPGRNFKVTSLVRVGDTFRRCRPVVMISSPRIRQHSRAPAGRGPASAAAGWENLHASRRDDKRPARFERVALSLTSLRSKTASRTFRVRRGNIRSLPCASGVPLGCPALDRQRAGGDDTPGGGTPARSPPGREGFA